MIENQIKTVLLLGLLTGLMLFVGQLIGGTTGLTFAIVFALIFNFGAYWFSDKIVLAMYKAKEAGRDTELYRTVERLTRKANLPMPKVYTIPSDNPNAFATGRSPKHAAVAATEGLLTLLTRDELEGVIAHELAHVKNRDTLIQTIAATIAGVISYIASMARWGMMFGGFGGRDDRDNSNILEMLALAIVTPLIAAILQFAISRSREYYADATGAAITKNPKGLASALLKIERGVKANPMEFGSTATSSLFIANPFKGEMFFELFSTHPPISKRVERLNNMRL